MRHTKHAVFFLAAWLAFICWDSASLGQQAKKSNPADVYLRAYIIMEDGIKMLQGSDYAGAYFKLKDARDIFDSVFHSDPGWNPEIVEYRRKKVKELMETAKQAEIERRRTVAANPNTVNPVAPPSPPMPAISPPAKPLPESPSAPRPTEAVVQAKTQDLQQRIAQLEAKNDTLLRQIGARDEELRQSGAKLVESQNAQKALLERLTNAEAKIATADASKKRDQAGLEKQIAALTNERDGLKSELGRVGKMLEEANTQNAKLLADVQEAYGQIKALGEEKKALAAERDQLQALMQGENAPGSVKTLAADNAKLRRTLDELRGQIASLQKQREQEKQDAAGMQKRLEADAKTIADLRGQLETARGELAAMKQQTRDYQEQMAALSARLEATEKTLSESGAPAISEAEALGENRLLREIVLKMLKQQAGREKAKQQTVVLLEQNGQLSEELLRNLNEMSGPYQLSPAERALLNAAGMPKEVAGSGIQMEMLAPVPPAADADSPAATAGNPAGSPKDKSGLSDELRAFATAAEVCFRDQRFDEAEANYKKILKDQPQNVHSLCNLAVVQMRQGRVDDAINNLKKGLAYEYQNDFAHYLLGNCHLRQGNIPEAIASINEGLKIKPDNAEGHLSLGFIYIRQKKFSAAEKEFLQAVEFNPSCADAHYNLAVLYATSENPRLDLAKSHYRRALQNGASPDAGLDKFLGR